MFHFTMPRRPPPPQYNDMDEAYMAGASDSAVDMEVDRVQPPAARAVEDVAAQQVTGQGRAQEVE